MKLAFSNIAWAPHDDPLVLALLREQGVTGIEVAPTRVWPNWDGATPGNAELYRRRLRSLGFEVPALQAVLFGKPEAQLFEPQGVELFVSHLTKIAEIAGALGANTVVLGAPKQRDRGPLAQSDAVERAAEVLQPLARIFTYWGSCLCIEPNPRRYGCNFVINAEQGAELVRRVNHPGFGLHLDAAGLFLEKDDLQRLWPEVGSLVRHFHISEPDLGDFCAPQVPHDANLSFLMSQGYAGWCSVEMREPKASLAIAGPWQILARMV